jgi:putative oxidoreductase
MRPLSTPVSDVVALLARLLLGAVLVAHGAQKLFQWGLGGTTASFQGMGVPLPGAAAFYATVVESVGGLLLIAGLATTVVAALVVLEMIGAAIAVHIPNGVFVADGGWELVGVIAVAGLLLAAFGPGRFSLDGVRAGRRTAARV